MQGTHQTLQRKPPTKPTQSNKGASRSGQVTAGAAAAGLVRLIMVMVDHVTTAHVLSGATNEQSTSSLGREDLCDGARAFI